MTSNIKGYLLPLLAILLSGLALTGNLSLANIFQFIVSVVGIAAGIAFFVNRKYFYPLIQIWIYGQFPAFNRAIQSASGNGGTLELHPLLDGGQHVTFDVGLTFVNSAGYLDLKINILPLVFLFLFKVLQVSDLIGRRLIITNVRKENKLGDIFPLKGNISETFSLGKEKNWFHAELDEPFEYEGNSYQDLLFRSREGDMYKPGKGKYSYLRLVSDPKLLAEKGISKDRFSYVDWAKVEVN
ncbi:MAG: hypothetical protein WBB45_07125 [Cyclobacteriaceae bacterium]